MKLIQTIFCFMISIIYCLDKIDKRGDVIYSHLNRDSLLIISGRNCYRYTPEDEFSLLSDKIPAIFSKGSSLLKASASDIILIGNNPLVLLHLDINCFVIKHHNSVLQIEPDYQLKLTLLSTGEVITAWVYQSNLFLIKYALASNDFSVQSYSFPDSNSNNVQCEEIALNKLLCVYYANDLLMFGLYDIATSSLIDELSSRIVDINQIDSNGHLTKSSSPNQILYCLKALESKVLCIIIKESNDSIEICNSVFINDFFTWTNAHQLFVREFPTNELLIFSHEGTVIKTQKSFTNLTMKGSVYHYDFKLLLSKIEIDYGVEMLLETIVTDNDYSLLVMYKMLYSNSIKIALLSMGSLDDSFFIGLSPKGGEANIGYYIKHTYIIFHFLPTRGRFVQLDYSTISINRMYNVNDIIFQYDPIVDAENKVNEWNGIIGTVSSQGDSFDLAVFSHQKPIKFGYCYSLCDTCFDWGDDFNHNCIECAEGYHHLDSNMKQCYNNDTRPENSFWDDDLNYFGICFGNCKTCHQRGDKSNYLCDSCKEPQFLQPKGDRNCVVLCKAPLRWYVDIHGNYFCTLKAECLNGYPYYNPTTNECLRKCSEYNEVYYEYECYECCPHDTYLIESMGECVVSCGDKLAIDAINRKCVNCALNNQYNYNRVCIDIPLRPDDTYIEDIEYNVLKDCFYIDRDIGVIKTYYGIIAECINQCPLNHYYTPQDSICNPCYSTCNTCFQKGSDGKHNCIECKANHVSHPFKKGMCFPKCSLYWFIDLNMISNPLQCTNDCIKHSLYLNPETNECVNDCPSSKVIHDNKCLDECPESSMIIHNYKCYEKDTPPIEMEDDWQDLFNKEIDSLTDYYSNLSDISPSIIENDNFTIQVIDPKNESAIKEAIDNELSLINLGPCEDVLRKHYGIPSDKPLLILKIDIKENDMAITPVVKYKVYDYTGALLDLGLCHDLKIEIDYPIVNENEINLIKGKEYNSKGIDVYSHTDPFFNDICYPHTSNDDKDIPIQDRRNDIYQNVSLCQNGCLYQGVDFETKRVSCQCNSSINENEVDENEELKNELLGEAFELFDSSTIMIVTCYKLVLQVDNIVFNVGFWLFGAFILVIIVTIGLFSWFGYVKLYAYLNKFPHHNRNQRIDENNENKEQKPMSIPLHPPAKHKTIAAPSKHHNEAKVLSSSFENKEYCLSKNYHGHTYEYEYHKKSSNPNGNVMAVNENSNYKTEYRFPQTQLESNELLRTPQKNQCDINDQGLSLRNSIYNNKTLGMALMMAPTTYNTPIGSNKTLAFKSSLSKAPTGIVITSPFSIEKTNRCLDSNTKLHLKSLTVAPLKLDSDKASNKPYPNTNRESNFDDESILDYDSLEIEEAMIKDTRNLCVIYWESIKTDQMIISLCANKSPFAPFLIRFNLFIFTMSLFFAMNALLFTEQQISTRYHSNVNLNMFYLIKNEFTKCLYASLITSLVTSVFMYLVSNYNIRRLIKETTDPDEYILGIKKHLSSFKCKINFFFFISLGFAIFCWYFATVFCVVYRNNRISWIEGSLITFALSNLLGFALLFVSAVLRFMANRMKWWCLFKVSLYVKDFAT